MDHTREKNYKKENENNGKKNKEKNEKIKKIKRSNSLNAIPFYHHRKKHRISDEERTELILNELSLVGKEVQNKQVETQNKASFYRVINTLSSLIIIAFSAVIVGLEVASSCLNIPIIVLTSCIFLVESTHKLFGWGPLGIMYKNGTVQLKRISQQVREYMYFYQRYSDEQLLSLISLLRTQYDELDLNLYRFSASGSVRYGNGLDIEEGNLSNVNLSNITNVGNNSVNNSNKNTPTVGSPNAKKENSSPHVHIHIDGVLPGTPTVEKSEKSEKEKTKNIKKLSEVKLPNVPSNGTPPIILSQKSNNNN